jgi:hypothetical protein
MSLYGVRREDPSQMGLAEDGDVIEAFPTDQTDRALGMSILPRRTRRTNAARGVNALCMAFAMPR